jgi:mannose-1-phosphate guanylyltransferase / mannose-6-phosphate isomerase
MLIPVILSGGAGSRLWPVSRELHPKPFIKLEDGQSLIHKTIARTLSLEENIAQILTICNHEHYFLMQDEYADIASKHNHFKHIKQEFLLEPVGRNTAPAIISGALLLAKKYSDEAVMLVMPADHIISNQQNFKQAVKQAYKLAKNDYLVTFGIVPDHPNTGFGYIQKDLPIESDTSKAHQHAYHVKKFHEKPDAQTAQNFIDSGDYFWNGGIFAFKVSTLLNAIQKQDFELYQSVLTAFEHAQCPQTSKNICALPSSHFAQVPDISIDYALMEKADKIAVVPADIGWLDVGSWRAMGELSKQDENGNASKNDAILIDVKNCYIHNEKRLVAMVGVEDLVIVDTDDALLIAHKNQTQDVKKVVEHLKSHAHDSYKLHTTVNRPWGTYTVLEEEPSFKIKRIVVKPQQKLSLQMHHHRSEHWIVVSGMAKIINDDQEMMINTNESTFIKAGHKHRLENPGVIDLVMIEVQSGQYLGEDDIVRFSDNYGRV